MGSALLDTTPAIPTDSAGPVPSRVPHPTEPTPNAESLRLQVAERLAAHRSRRGQASQVQASSPGAAPSNARAARIAATVAERYAQQQTYHAFLAAEAERAVQQARAAAEVAAMNARAVAQAQQDLLQAMQAKTAPSTTEPLPTEADTEPSLWPDLGPIAPLKPINAPRQPSQAWGEAQSSTPVAASAPERKDSATLTVRLYEDESSAAHVCLTPHPVRVRENRRFEHDETEARALDEEIEFRQAPVFEEPAGPPEALPANLIEFPRQLVAARKARPRYAEGPLREETEEPGNGQLRIFEVDPAQIATTPLETETAAAQWTSIWLDQPQPSLPQTVPDTELPEHRPTRVNQFPEAASVSRRVAAAAINGGIIAAAAGSFAAVFLFASGSSLQQLRESALRTLLHPAASGPQPAITLGAAAVVLSFLYLLYQALFFSFSGATPGMRCARIALCTFDDENPTRTLMRRRIAAVLLSVCPLGLGFLWATLDEDRLTWHDRVSRTYQRTY